MADIPKDPRQLARDILAGKVSIQDLAREQAKRAAAGGLSPQRAPARPVPPPQQRQVVPPPRQVQPPARQAQQLKAFPQQQQAVRRPPMGGGRGQQPAQQVRKPASQGGMKLAPVVTTPDALDAPKLAISPLENVGNLGVALPAKKSLTGSGVGSIREAVRSRGALRRAVVMAEILGKPVGLREE